MTRNPLQDMTQGVLYYNAGTACLVRLLVSLTSLRKFYDGSIAILSEGDDSHSICETIASEYNATVIRSTPDAEDRPNRILLTKTQLNVLTPYDITVFLDSDTVVMGDIQPLFEFAATTEFCVAQFADWRSDCKRYRSRIKAWESLAPDYIEAAINFGPAINTGVMAFLRTSSMFAEWSILADKGRNFFIPDEVSCQILLPHHKHRVIESLWNCSCKYDSPDNAHVKIIHYHGRKHCRPGLPFHAELWVQEFMLLVHLGTANVRNWMPAGDRYLERFLMTHGNQLYNEVLHSKR